MSVYFVMKTLRNSCILTRCLFFLLITFLQIMSLMMMSPPVSRRLDGPVNDQAHAKAAFSDGWSRDLEGYPSTPASGVHFSKGIDPKTPADFFTLIFTKILMKLSKIETNRYAAS